MKITLRITRFDPEKDAGPSPKDYTVEVEPTDRILDALMKVKAEQDGSLSFRKSCAHGVCGSDAMIINGAERLACKTLVRDVAQEVGVVTVAPLRFLPVQRDLMVDQAPFFEKFRSVKPFLITDEAAPATGERPQSPEERLRFDDATSCILCACCYSSCPVFEGTPSYLGPAAIVNAARFIFDSRDSGLPARLPALDTPDGVWACKNHFNCTRVCPREIKVTKNINAAKRAITRYKEAKG